MPQFAKTLFFLLIVAVQVFVIFLLVTGNNLLEQPVWRDPPVPLGTPLTWFLAIAFPFSFYRLSGRRPAPNALWRFARALFALAIVLGIAWGIAGYWLSGNWSYNFIKKPEEWRWFMNFNLLFIGTLFTAFLAWGFGVIWVWARKKTAA